MQDLLELAFDDPEAARRVADGVIATDSDPVARSFAHQALGIVHREAGDTRLAIAELRVGLRQAQRSKLDDRERDVRATYGATLLYAGRTSDGLMHLRRAAEGAVGSSAGRVGMRLALALLRLGRHDEGIAAMESSVKAICEAGDEVWEGRARTSLGYALLVVGRVDRAATELAQAERLFQSVGSTLEVLDVIESKGEISIAKGDLARGLRELHEALAGYQSEGREPRLDLVFALAKAYLAASLVDNAAEILESSVVVEAQPELRRADLYLMRATARLAANDEGLAVDDAMRAIKLFRRQHRAWFEMRARSVAVRARFALGDKRGLARDAGAIAESLHLEDADEAPVALTLAGRLTKGDERLDHWRRAATYRSRDNGLVRAAAYVARSLEREATGDRGGVLRACAAGLDAIDEHRRLMGSSELRALATTHGRELAEIALRHAAHDPRTLLRWSERTRATALAQPPATSDVATIPASLASLRDNGRRLAEARQAGEPTEDLEKERLRLERAVRTESHTVSAASDPQRPAGAEEIVAGVGDGCLVELVDVDGTLHVLVVHTGRVRRRVAGATAEVNDLLGPASMLLRRASRGRAANTADIGRRLQDAILGDAARLIPDGPVTLAPTARLHGLAWSLLPTLHDRPFSVVPSAGQWLRAREVRRPTPRRTLLVAGPDLESGGAEVPVLAQRLAGAVLLDGPRATVADVLEALDGADLAHLATHGRFRADSPLFSSLDLADGPLTVHDLERLTTAPYRVVLSACESGVLAPVGAQELLGLAAALFSIGSGGLVCSVAEVNDAATAGLMVGLHESLAAGGDPATALLHVRRAAAADPVAAGTAAAFVALGV